MTSVAYGALWIFIFAVPWERLASMPGVAIVTRVTGALALGLALLAMVVNGRIRRWQSFQVMAFLFVTWTGLSILIHGFSVIPQKYYTFVQLFLVLWMIWELAPTEARWRGLLSAYVLGASVPAIATILLFIQAGTSLRRFSAGGADPNNLAMTLALAVPIAWYLSLTAKRTSTQWIFRAFLPLCVFATVLTGSRGGMVTLMFALLVIPLTLSLSPGRLAAAIVLLGLSGALAIAYAPQQVVERLGTTTDSEGASLGGRLKLWNAGFNAFTRKPFIGYGVSGFKRAVTPELGILALVAHNSFLSVLVEEGLIGLVLYSMMLLTVFLSLLRLPTRLERRFGLVLLLTLGIAMSPLTWEDNKATWLILSFLAGMTALRITARRPGDQRRAVAVGRPLAHTVN